VEFSFQGSPSLRDSIERAKELLSHKFPFGDLNDVLSEVVRDYLERHDPQRTLAFGRAAPAKSGLSVPAAIRRAVWARDGGRCTFSAPDGVRCLSRRALEIDHRTPRALGGTNAVENLRLLCRPHNDAERRRILGEGELFTNSARDEFGDNSPAGPG
jgi:5-methylcytosine-specific restriction endonuclease McrA